MSDASTPGPRIPRATYRLQFHAGFRLADATALVPYLAALGISDLYASPLLKARPGSTHGYDTIDPGSLNPELGDEADFDALCEALDAHDMKLLLDIVPNHMGVLEADNAWWLDVLEHGPAARHAHAFDIDWQPPQRELHGKVLLAVLGKAYGEALESSELDLSFDRARGQFVVRYFGHCFPIDLRDHADLLGAVALPEALVTTHGDLVRSVIDTCAGLPVRDCDPVERDRRRHTADWLKDRLTHLHGDAPGAADWLDACAAGFAGREGEPASFDALDRLLERQAYRLTHWRAAGAQVNYRRFFDVNALAGLRIEDDSVFDAVHCRVLEWVAEGRVAGLRIDHPDGMAHPAAYFARLQRSCAELLRQPKDQERSIYLVVEKILADDEPWRQDWPVHGDTGYRFANQALGLFVDASQAPAFDALTTTFVGGTCDFDAELDAAKRSIMSLSLGADLRRLTELARDLALGHRHTRDLTRDDLRDAIVELASAFDVYRCYVAPRDVDPLDIACVERCTSVARTRCRPSQRVHVAFLRGLLLPEGDEPEPRRAHRLQFVQRFQQFTAPVMAKAMEDTAFYRYHRLISLNDVGGDPRRFGMSPAELHAANAGRQREMPHTLLTTSTHDSKRSEDVRARLNVLSEMPETWSSALDRWRSLAQTQWRIAEVAELPNAGDLLLLFQTLLGVCPLELRSDADLHALRDRVTVYMLKAVREAKQRTSWLDADDLYEAALQHSIEVLLSRLEPNPFLSDLRRFVAAIAPFGASNSLGLVAMKLTAPGVPDIFQGGEDWSFALVDPDNRRPVDFEALARHLQALQGRHESPPAGESLPARLQKLHAVQALLHWRAEVPDLFQRGSYSLIEPRGEHAEHVFAFSRCFGAHSSLTVISRLNWRRCKGDAGRIFEPHRWGNTVLSLSEAAPEHPRTCMWLDVLTGRRFPQSEALPMSELLTALPCAVLRREQGAPVKRLEELAHSWDWPDNESVVGEEDPGSALETSVAEGFRTP